MVVFLSYEKQVYHVLRSCQVEMIIFDEAQRATARTMSEIRAISDILEIAVVLVGTDRRDTAIVSDQISREATTRAFQRGQNLIELPLLRQVGKDAHCLSNSDAQILERNE